MNYIDYEEKLDDTLQGLPQATQAVFSKDSVTFLLEEIGGSFNLTLGEIGEICELVRQIITKEREPKDFEAGLVEKLDEDNREKIPQIVSLMSEKIFSKLLPALGIKVPIEFAVKVGVPKVEGLEIPPLAPAHPAPLPKMAPPSASVPPPTVAGSVLHQTYQARTTYQGGALIKPNLKPPLMETSHESMAVNPLESLIQMLEGKVSQKDLSRQFEKLPESLKNALGSVDSAKKVVDIGRKYALHMDKLGELGAETGMVILGFTHPAEFLSRLTKHLGLPEDKVRPIAQEINTEVFLKIREALKQVHGETEVKTTPPPLPPQLSGVGGGKFRGQAPKPRQSPVTGQLEKPMEESGYYGQNQTASAYPIPIKKPEDDTSPPETEEVLDREAILRDIENPVPTLRVELGVRNQESGVKPKATDTPLSKLSPTDAGKLGGQATTPFPKEIPPKLTSLPKPVLSQTPLETKTTPEPTTTTRVEPTIIPTPTPAPTITAFTPTPEAPPVKPQNIIDQKLSGTTSSTKSESSYTSDPYRESLG